MSMALGCPHGIIFRPYFGANDLRLLKCGETTLRLCKQNTNHSVHLPSVLHDSHNTIFLEEDFANIFAKFNPSPIFLHISNWCDFGKRMIFINKFPTMTSSHCDKSVDANSIFLSLKCGETHVWRVKLFANLRVTLNKKRDFESRRCETQYLLSFG